MRIINIFNMQNTLLQKTFQNLICNHEGHQQEPLNYVCISQQCNHSPVMCYLCSLENHSDHEKISLKVFLKQLLSVETKSQKVIPLCAQIDKIFDRMKRKLVEYEKNFSNFDLVIKTFQSFRELNISYALEFYKLVDKIFELFQETQDFQKVQKLNQFIKISYFKYFSEVEGDQWTKINISEALLSKKIESLNFTLQSLEKLHAIHKLNDHEVLNLFPLAVETTNKVKVHFSQDLKPDCMTLLSPTHAKMDKTGSQRLLILQPCLSKTMSIKKWGVRIIKLASWIGVGVCHINEIKKANYMFQYTNTGHGNYLISSNGYAWSSYKKQYNSKFESFAYTTGDVIHLEYNPRERIIRFKKQSDPNQPTYELEVEGNDDPVHPEINLTGVNDEVQIINF